MAKKKSPKGSRPIITGFLEKIGAKVFVDHRNVITDLIKGHQGIYALYKNDRLYYVGLASNLRNRINQHLNDRHQGKWTHFSLYIIRKADHIKELESVVMRIADPKGNRVRGKLNSSKNLRWLLKSRLKQEWEKEINDIIGGREKIQKILKKRSKITKKTGRPLKGLFKNGKAIYASYKGKDYKAWVCRNGTIKFEGIFYDAPSTAGLAITKKKTLNGWSFWSYKNDSGNLVQLSRARK
ncbi:MAG: GIY-YIG nuclease family protein [Phycisphaerae bacterium]